MSCISMAVMGSPVEPSAWRQQDGTAGAGLELAEVDKLAVHMIAARFTAQGQAPASRLDHGGRLRMQRHLTPTLGGGDGKGSDPCHDINDPLPRAEGVGQAPVLLLQPRVPVHLHCMACSASMWRVRGEEGGGLACAAAGAGKEQEGLYLPEVQLEAGSVLLDLCLEAGLPCQDLHAEHAELILNGAQLQHRGRGQAVSDQATWMLYCQRFWGSITLFTTVRMLGFLSMRTCSSWCGLMALVAAGSAVAAAGQAGHWVRT